MRKSLGKSSIIFLLTIFVFTMGFAMLTIVGAGKIYSGNCGANGDGSDVKWSLNTNTGELTIKGSGAMKDYKKAVPWNSHRSQIITITMSEGITSICNDAFRGCSSLTSITIPDSVTSIGYDAFRGCSSLTSITIPNRVTSIGGYAFRDCRNLTSIIMPNSVTSIGDYTFYGCSSLTSVTIPNSVWSIGSGAFRGCSNLTSVTIPNSVTRIGSGAFSGCSSLSITVAADNKAYKSVNDVLFSNDGTKLLRYPLKKAGTSYEIPAGVTSIGDFAFQDCSRLTSITIPNSVTSIGYSAFEDCSSLTNITIPNSVTSIGNLAFNGCDKSLVICGVAGSAAEKYAKSNGINFSKTKCIAGDINGDEEVNIKDLILFAQYQARWDVEVNENALDVNGDNEVNIKDLILLAQYLAGWNVEIY